MPWEKVLGFLKSHLCSNFVKTQNNRFRVSNLSATNHFTFEKFPPPPPLLHPSICSIRWRLKCKSPFSGTPPIAPGFGREFDICTHVCSESLYCELQGNNNQRHRSSWGEYMPDSDTFEGQITSFWRACSHTFDGAQKYSNMATLITYDLCPQSPIYTVFENIKKSRIGFSERFMTVFRISQKLLSLLDIHGETMGFEGGAFFSLGSKARNYGWGVMKNLRMMKFQWANSDFSPKNLGGEFFSRWADPPPPNGSCAQAVAGIAVIDQCRHLLICFAESRKYPVFVGCVEFDINTNIHDTYTYIHTVPIRAHMHTCTHTHI